MHQYMLKMTFYVCVYNEGHMHDKYIEIYMLILQNVIDEYYRNTLPANKLVLMAKHTDELRKDSLIADSSRLCMNVGEFSIDN